MASLDPGAIRAEVDRTLPALLKSSDDELLAAIGSIPLDPAFPDADVPPEVLELGISDFGLARLGRAFLKANTRVREVVCNSKDEFSDLIDTDNVSKLVNILMPALGVAGLASPPTAALALAVFLLKIGLNEYCKDHEGE